MVTVREVRPSEYERAGDVTASAYREYLPVDARGHDGDGWSWTSYLAVLADVRGRAERTVVLVAIEDDAVLGTATLELDGRVDPASPPLPPGEAHLRMLGVLPEVRGRGIARQLLEAVVARASAAGRGRLTLNTGEDMVAAQQLYERYGFRREGDLEMEDGALRSYVLDLAQHAQASA